jgi:hypothetical protein
LSRHRNPNPGKKKKQGNNMIMPRQGLRLSTAAGLSSSAVNILSNHPSTQEQGQMDHMTYWNSGLAKKTFGVILPHNTNEDEEFSIIQQVERRIERLKQAYQSPSGWKLVVDDLDAQSLYSDHDQFQLCWMARYIAKALTIALDHPLEGRKQPTWEDCCKIAINQINAFEDFQFVTSPQTIMRWHLKYRKHKECFPNRHVVSADGCSELPPLLQQYPEGKSAMLSFAKEHLNALSAETLYNHIHDVILPELAELCRVERGLDQFSVQELLLENGLTKLSIPTIYRWMRKLGFKYEVRRKYAISTSRTLRMIATVGARAKQ